ncbi:MAG: hypothetical protein ACE5JP_07295 [Candidatus Bipolaricaulia bacterium]
MLKSYLGMILLTIMGSIGMPSAITPLISPQLLKEKERFDSNGKALLVTLGIVNFSAIFLGARMIFANQVYLGASIGIISTILILRLLSDLWITTINVRMLAITWAMGLLIILLLV